jgi:hypothetical protein
VSLSTIQRQAGTIGAELLAAITTDIWTVVDSTDFDITQKAGTGAPTPIAAAGGVATLVGVNVLNMSELNMWVAFGNFAMIATDMAPPEALGGGPTTVAESGAILVPAGGSVYRQYLPPVASSGGVGAGIESIAIVLDQLQNPIMKSILSGIVQLTGDFWLRQTVTI